MTEAQIKYMVDRFLGWKLPENFHPDAGITFTPIYNEAIGCPTRHEPSGTNLFDATQADAMVRYMLEGIPAEAAESALRTRVGLTLPELDCVLELRRWADVNPTHKTAAVESLLAIIDRIASQGTET